MPLSQNPQAIRDATRDIDVNLVFNNAGYITTGLFADLDLNRQLKNYEVRTLDCIVACVRMQGAVD